MISRMCFPTKIFVYTTFKSVFFICFVSFGRNDFVIFDNYLLFFMDDDVCNNSLADYTKIKLGPPLQGHSPSTISILVHLP